MATIINFPDKDERQERDDVEFLCGSLIKSGASPAVAQKSAAFIVDEYREFKQALAKVPVTFHEVTQAEAELLQAAAEKIANAVYTVFVAQRLAGEQRRLGLARRR